MFLFKVLTFAVAHVLCKYIDNTVWASLCQFFPWSIASSLYHTWHIKGQVLLCLFLKAWNWVQTVSIQMCTVSCGSQSWSGQLLQVFIRYTALTQQRALTDRTSARVQLNFLNNGLWRRRGLACVSRREARGRKCLFVPSLHSLPKAVQVAHTWKGLIIGTLTSSKKFFNPLNQVIGICRIFSDWWTDRFSPAVIVRD